MLSILLESSVDATIHDTLDYFLRLLYEVLEMAPKRRLGACTVFNTFVDVFRWNLLKLFGRCGAILPVGCGNYAGWEEDQF